MNLKKISAVTLLVTGLLIPSAYAADKEDVIKFRQSTFQVIKWNFSQLVGMAKGDIAFDKAKAEAHAKYLDVSTEMLKDAFVSGSYEGSNTKPEIESKMDNFQKHYQSFSDEVKKLASVAGDEAGLKSQFGKVGANCKACHDDFKKD